MSAAAHGSGEALAGALEYAAAGYAVGPVTIRWNAARGRKDPEFHTDWRYPEPGEVSISSDPDQITAWARAHPYCGFHMPCGPNGVVVPEGDVKRARADGTVALKDGITAWRDAGGPRPAMIVRTPSGGQHWYFPAPADDIHGSVNEVLPGVDVRGVLDTVFIAGTRVHGHPNGPDAFYSTDRVVPASELAPLPQSWEHRLRAGHKASATSGRPAAAGPPGFATPDMFHDRNWIVDQVRDACERADALTEANFRHDFFGVAATLHAAADAVPELVNRDEVDEVLADAVRRVWGAPPNYDDRCHMRAAREKATANPWKVSSVPDHVPPRPDRVPDRDAVPGPPPSETAPTSENSVADRVRDAVGTRWDAVGGKDGDEDGSETDDERSSWAPVDLAPFLDGSFVPPAPAFLERTDGHALFYEGGVHWLFGENESGKSWVALVAVARALLDDRPCLFVDYESDPGEVSGRLLALGVPGEVMLARLSYVAPEVSTLHDASSYRALIARPYAFAVVDGVTAAMGTEGKSIIDNDEIGDWARTVPKRIARATGAAVVVIDHVVKDKDGRGRFPVGGQQKLNEVTGSAYMIEPGENPIMKGRIGQLVMWIAKDRPSGVRPHCGEWHKVTRMQEAARIELNAQDPEALVVTISPPEGMASGGAPVPKKLTWYMERCSDLMQHTEGEVSQTTIVKNVGGKAEHVRSALRDLTRLGYLTRREGQRNSFQYTFVKRYSALLDTEHAGQTGPDWHDEDDDD